MLSRSRISRIAVLLSVVALAGCQGEPGLPSDEVLRRAAEAARGVTSALFSVDGALEQKTADGTMDVSVNADGRLQNGGEQIDLRGRMRVAMTQGAAGAMEWDVSGNVVVIDEHEVYLRIENARVEPASAFPVPLGPEALETWLRLPAESAAPAPDVTPDPRFLRMQAEVVRVVKDEGIVAYGGKRAYHYDVAVDPDKLRAFLEEMESAGGGGEQSAMTQALLQSTNLRGELWIDAETFVVHRIEWDAEPAAAGGLDGNLTVTLRDHNTAPPVVPPENAVPLQSVLQHSSPGLTPEEAEILEQYFQAEP